MQAAAKATAVYDVNIATLLCIFSRRKRSLKDGVFYLLVIACPLYIIAHYVISSRRSRYLIDGWAERHGLTVTQAQRSVFGGPFTPLGFSKAQTVYHVHLVDGHGRTRKVYARCGSYWSGVFSSDEITVLDDPKI